MNLTLFGGMKNTLRSAPQDGEQLIAAFGGIDLDLSQITLPESLRMSAFAFAGGIKLRVPRGTDIELSGFSLMGGREVKPLRDRSPEEVRTVLYLNAVAIMGGVEVIEAES
jgi:hypothetical protein